MSVHADFCINLQEILHAFVPVKHGSSSLLFIRVYTRGISVYLVFGECFTGHIHNGSVSSAALYWVTMFMIETTVFVCTEVQEFHCLCMKASFSFSAWQQNRVTTKMCKFATGSFQVADPAGGEYCMYEYMYRKGQIQLIRIPLTFDIRFAHAERITLHCIWACIHVCYTDMLYTEQMPKFGYIPFEKSYPVSGEETL